MPVTTNKGFSRFCDAACAGRARSAGVQKGERRAQGSRFGSPRHAQSRPRSSRISGRRHPAAGGRRAAIAAQGSIPTAAESVGPIRAFASHKGWQPRGTSYAGVLLLEFRLEAAMLQRIAAVSSGRGRWRCARARRTARCAGRSPMGPRPVRRALADSDAAYAGVRSRASPRRWGGEPAPSERSSAACSRQSSARPAAICSERSGRSR